MAVPQCFQDDQGPLEFFDAVSWRLVHTGRLPLMALHMKNGATSRGLMLARVHRICDKGFTPFPKLAGS